MDFDGSTCFAFPLFVDYHGFILGYPNNKQVQIVFPKWFGDDKNMDKKCIQWTFQIFP